jgi:hypothetical protein
MIKIYILLILLLAIGCGPAEDQHFQDVCPATNRPRYVVVTHPKGHGFANRIRAMASAYTLSVLTGRTLVVDWQISPNEVPVGFNQLFKNKILTLDDIVYPDGISANNIRSLHSDGKYLQKFNLNNKKYETQDNESRRSCADIIWIESWYRFKHKGVTFNEIRDIHVGFLKALEPVDEISSQVNSFVKEHLIEQKDTIGVHFRSFTLTADSHIKARTTPKEREQAMIQAMHNELKQNGNVIFFVATDSLPALIRMKKEFGEHRILSREKQAERSTASGMIDGVIDWYLLTKTERILGSLESSFSEEAALLTSSGIKIDVGPAFF